MCVQVQVHYAWLFLVPRNSALGAIHLMRDAQNYHCLLKVPGPWYTTVARLVSVIDLTLLLGKRFWCTTILIPTIHRDNKQLGLLT